MIDFAYETSYKSDQRSEFVIFNQSGLVYHLLLEYDLNDYELGSGTIKLITRLISI